MLIWQVYDQKLQQTFYFFHADHAVFQTGESRYSRDDGQTSKTGAKTATIRLVEVT